MKYNYEKLKKPDILSMTEMYFNTREINILVGKERDIIYFGESLMFFVENGVLYYYRGLSKSTSYEIRNLAKLMDKIQSVITLECPEFDGE